MHQFYLRSVSTAKEVNEMLKPLISKDSSDLKPMEILFPVDVYSGGVLLPQYREVLRPSMMITASKLHPFGSTK